MKRKVFLFGLLGLIALMWNHTWAQQLDPVKWSYSVRYPSDSTAELVMDATLDPTWHIYSQYTSPEGPLPIEFHFTPSTHYTALGKVSEPKPHEELDDIFNVVVKSFSGKVRFVQQIKRNSSTDFDVNGTFSYQACSDADGTCLAPEDHDLRFRVKGAVKAVSPISAKGEGDAEEVSLDTATAPDATTTLDTATAPAELIEAVDDESSGEEHHSLWGYFWIAIGAGILTMFTPCVFPMIPMTVNFFLRGAENRRKGRRQAWFFGFSIVFLFAVLGAILAWIFGPDMLYIMGTHWIPNLIFFAIFFVFALSFFGLFEIKMPERWINASDAQADKGGLLAPFFIALTTVLVSFSCTGPIIGSALMELSTSTTNRWISLVTMLGFGIGFALPFTLLAMSPELLKKLRSGSWLNTVKVVFAFLELAFGLKFLQQADLYCNWGILDREVYLALWIVIFGLLGVYLLGKLRFKGDDEVHHIGVGRLMLAVIDLAFVVYMIPGLWGAPLNGISGFIPPMNTQDYNIEKIILQHTQQRQATATTDYAEVGQLPSDRKYVNQLEVPLGFEAFFDLDEAKAYARKVGKPLFIDFTGKTCANCREMEQNVWSKEEVRQLINNEYVLVSLFCDVNTIELPESEWVTDNKGHVLKTLGRKNLWFEQSNFNMNAQPYYVVIDADGKVLTAKNHKYDRNVQHFVDWLNEGLANFHKYRNILAKMKSERPDVYEWYEYYNNRDGDLTELAKTNKYAKQHLDWYQDVGYVDGREAATIQLTYGADWDYSLLTPANSFEKVLARLGEEEYKTGKPLTLEEFKSYGGKYRQNEDGGYTVQVDKTNTQLLNKLLRASYGKQSKNPLRVLFTEGEMYPTYLESFDVNGNCLTESLDRIDKDIATNNQDNALTRYYARGSVSPNYQPTNIIDPVNSHNTTAVRGIYQLNRDADKAIKKYLKGGSTNTQL